MQALIERDHAYQRVHNSQVADHGTAINSQNHQKEKEKEQEQD